MEKVMSMTLIQSVVDRQPELRQMLQVARANTYTSPGTTVDGIPMTTCLANFYKAIKAVPAYRRLNAYIYPAASTLTPHGVQKLALAFPEDVYVLASISHTAGNYTVTSESIRNDRYKIGSPDHYRVSSMDMARALRNFKTNIRPLPPTSLLTRMAESTQGLMTGAYQTAQRELSKKWGDILDESISRSNSTCLLRAELIHAYRSGHQFMDARFRKLMDDMMASYKEVNDSPLPTKIHLVFIRFYGNGEVDITTPSPYTMVNNSYRSQIATDDKVLNVRENQVPDWLMNKVSALRMLEAQMYVPGLGVKRAENAYLVERDASNEHITIA